MFFFIFLLFILGIIYVSQNKDVLQKIIDAAPTDGLWDDGRTDQDQLGGMTYVELESAMRMDTGELVTDSPSMHDILNKYRAIRARSLHKMNPIPVYQNI